MSQVNTWSVVSGKTIMITVTNMCRFLQEIGLLLFGATLTVSEKHLQQLREVDNFTPAYALGKTTTAIAIGTVFGMNVHMIKKTKMHIRTEEGFEVWEDGVFRCGWCKKTLKPTEIEGHLNSKEHITHLVAEKL